MTVAAKLKHGRYVAFLLADKMEGDPQRILVVHTESLMQVSGKNNL